MLTLGFFLIALLYSTVGFGGGSSYLAMLTFVEVPFELVPKLALICNLLVVSSGCWNFYQSGHFNRLLILPLVLSSVPMALIGGMYHIKEATFLLLMAASLIMSGIRLLFVSKSQEGDIKPPPVAISVLVGSALGLLSGLVGLGGGIILAPLMLNLKWARPKEVAAASSAFIFLNSASGLIGQFTKDAPEGLTDYFPLFIAVIIGGQIGSWIGGHKKVSHDLIQRGTAVLILIVSTRLLIKILAH